MYVYMIYIYIYIYISQTQALGPRPGHATEIQLPGAWSHCGAGWGPPWSLRGSSWPALRSWCSPRSLPKGLGGCSKPPSAFPGTV